MSLRRRLVVAWLRHVERPFLARATRPVAARRRFRLSARIGFRAPQGLRRRRDAVAGVPILWAHGTAPRDGLLLWFHGGAYVMGGPETHAKMVGAIAIAAGCRAALPRYRLAPEHPFPAAATDARAVWDGLIARGWDPGRIVLGGDSAGGGLMLGLLAGLLGEGTRPAGAVAFAPWADLTLSGDSLTRNAASEILLPPARLREIRDFYIGWADPADPRASPVLAEFANAPPGFLAAAPDEILFDDAVRIADRLEAGGTPPIRHWRPGLPHVWPILRGWLPEADETIGQAGAFVARCLDQAAVSTR
jgi:monoterpene epsilon-lactone hydrolase